MHGVLSNGPGVLGGWIVLVGVVFGVCAGPLWAASTGPVLHDDFERDPFHRAASVWSSWSASSATTPVVTWVKGRGRGGGAAVRVSGGGNAQATGTLHRDLALEAGRRYRVTVFARVDGELPAVRHLYPLVRYHRGANTSHWQSRRLVPEAVDGEGWVRWSRVIDLPNDAGDSRIDLFAGWLGGASVFWDDLSVERLDGPAPKPTTIHVVAVDGHPSAGCSMMDNARFYAERIRRAGEGGGVDFVCLTEMFNTYADPPVFLDRAVTFDSPYMKVIKDAAAEAHVNVVGSILEKRGGVYFNTGFLLNRKGELMGRAPKTHPDIDEMLQGISRGDELEPIPSEFGPIGVLICWDFHFPEASRSLVLRGARILFIPIAGEARLVARNNRGQRVSESWLFSTRACAVNNQVPVVGAVSSKTQPAQSIIVDGGGRIVAESGLGPGRVDLVRGAVTLDAPRYMWSGDDRWLRYWTERRPSLYTPITDPGNLIPPRRPAE